jgi:hypothetical protein
VSKPTRSGRREAGTRLGLGVLGLLLVMSGCDAADAGKDDLASALPTAELFDVSLPGEDDDGDLGVIDAPLLGTPSGVRDLARGVRKFLRLNLLNVLESIDRVLASNPLVDRADHAVWRLPSGDGLAQHAVVMRREDDGPIVVHVWIRSARANAPANFSDWRFLMTGRIVRDTALGATRGVLWIDLDNDLKPRSRGKVMALWSLVGGRRTLEVVTYDGTPDDGEVARQTRSFRYEAGPGGGLLAFDAGKIDVHIDPRKPAEERVRVFVRWNDATQLRGDYSATGEEVKADGFRVLLGSECWVPPSAEVAYESRLGLPLRGGEPVTLYDRGDRTACPFPEQEAPIVPPPGDAPVEPARPSDLDAL